MDALRAHTKKQTQKWATLPEHATNTVWNAPVKGMRLNTIRAAPALHMPAGASHACVSPYLQCHTGQVGFEGRGKGSKEGSVGSAWFKESFRLGMSGATAPTEL